MPRLVGMIERPCRHEDWCPDWGYEHCTCDLEERRAHWNQENRHPRAAPLPVARVVVRSPAGRARRLHRMMLNSY